MYILDDFICAGLLELWGTQAKIINWKSLAQSDRIRITNLSLTRERLKLAAKCHMQRSISQSYMWRHRDVQADWGVGPTVGLPTYSRVLKRASLTPDTMPTFLRLFRETAPFNRLLRCAWGYLFSSNFNGSWWVWANVMSRNRLYIFHYLHRWH